MADRRDGILHREGTQADCTRARTDRQKRKGQGRLQKRKNRQAGYTVARADRQIAQGQGQTSRLHKGKGRQAEEQW